jgi:hypothetical protein
MFFKLFVDCVRAAASRTFCTAGTSSAIRIAMIAITTSNSISVNAGRLLTKGWFIERTPKYGQKDQRLHTNAQGNRSS